MSKSSPIANDSRIFYVSIDKCRIQSFKVAICDLKRGQHRKYLPYAFTEHGAIMAANVLNSPRATAFFLFAVRLSVFFIRDICTRNCFMLRSLQVDQIPGLAKMMNRLFCRRTLSRTINLLVKDILHYE